jgi:hypothetical protein
VKTNKKRPGANGHEISDWIWSPEEGRLEKIEREAADGEEFGEVNEAAPESWDPLDDGFPGDESEETSRDEMRHAMVVKLIERIGQQLDAKDAPGKASVADLIRLMQLERALKPEQCRKFVVEWVDPKPEDL